NDHPLPTGTAFVPEAVVDRIELIVLVGAGVSKHQHEGVRIRVINDRAPGAGRKPDIPGLNRLDREQCVQPVDELFPCVGRQIRFQPEIHRVDEHGYSRPQGASFTATFFIWLLVNAAGCRHSMSSGSEMPSALRQTDRTRSAVALRMRQAPGSSGTRRYAVSDRPSDRT